MTETKSTFDRVKFWQDPPNSGAPEHLIPSCRPEFYLELDNVTHLWVSTLKKYVQVDDSILEIGCGTGRNLVGLQKAGFRDVAGIEISQKTVDIGREFFRHQLDITVGAIEDVEIPRKDVIYTSGLLMHLPHELDWVIDDIAQKAQKVIVIVEGEQTDAINAWTRNYQKVFEGWGWVQHEFEHCDKYPPLPYTTVKRVFLRE